LPFLLINKNQDKTGTTQLAELAHNNDASNSAKEKQIPAVAHKNPMLLLTK
jgi:hypothetical protein